MLPGTPAHSSSVCLIGSEPDWLQLWFSCLFFSHIVSTYIMLKLNLKQNAAFNCTSWTGTSLEVFNWLNVNHYVVKGNLALFNYWKYVMLVVTRSIASLCFLAFTALLQQAWCFPGAFLPNVLCKCVGVALCHQRWLHDAAGRFVVNLFLMWSDVMLT